MILKPSKPSDLQAQMRTYSRDEVVVFHRTRDSFGGLSNMASDFPLSIHGVTVPSAEALYQACRFPLHPEYQRQVIGQFSPMTAKMVSKTYRGCTRQDWMKVRSKVMRWCLRVKLAQHYEEFGRILLATRDLPIVEQSSKDDYWGAMELPDGRTLVGQNVLGRLLMELREQLKQDEDNRLVSVEPLDIPDFLFLGEPIVAIAAQARNRPQTSLF